MKKEHEIIISLILVVVSIVFLVSISGISKVDIFSQKVEHKNLEIDNSYREIVTGTTSADDVEISLKPVLVTEEKIEFEIKVNTHSVDLSGFNLMEIMFLRIGDNVYSPLSAPKLTGHHSSGKVEFEISGKPDSFEVRLDDIPKVMERIFIW